MAGPKFKHVPLDTSARHIRLISIIPEADGPIQCKIKHFDIDGNLCPDYRALSYTWGPPSPIRKIQLNNRWFTVRQNLFDFLVTFRTRLHKYSGHGQYDEVQWLWVDYLSIDQAVVEERNHQVQMMAEIYHKASYVYVWLGLSSHNIEQAMNDIKTEYRCHYDRLDSAARRKLAKSRHSKRNAAQPLEQDEYADLIVERREEVTLLKIDALREFFANPYWERLWIVQEIMLAKYIRIICGETLLSWDELRRFCSSGEIDPSMEARRLAPPQVLWLVEHALSAKLYSFSSLLRTFGQSECEDPRDKVYGLQGMLEEQHRMEIDYAKSVYEVFHDAVVIVIKDTIAPRTATEAFGYWGPFTRNKIDIFNQLQYAKPAEGILERAVLAMIDILNRLHYARPAEIFEQAVLTMKNIVNQFNYGTPAEGIFMQALSAMMNFVNQPNYSKSVERIFEQAALAMMNVFNQLNYSEPVEALFKQAALAMMDELNNAIDAYPMTISTNLGIQMGLEASTRSPWGRRHPDVIRCRDFVDYEWREVSSRYVKMHFGKIGGDIGIDTRTLDEDFETLCRAYGTLVYRFEESFERLVQCSPSTKIRHVSSFVCSKMED
ncbi:MAG: hypothetical protein M1822_003776 [Bathelium mastoideum]|nr:MAG: hypothetical protein M1822_003776 [Bathelium mastoideum]